MTIAYSSVREAYMNFLLDTVDPSRPIIDTHHADEIGDGSDCGSSRSMKVVMEEEPLEWNVIVQVPGDEEINEKEKDISTLGKEDLCRLKTDDPFLYYSIPLMRGRSYLCDDPEIMIQNISSTRLSSLRRKKRISTEAHPSLIFEEMMILEFQELDDGRTDDEMDLSVAVADLKRWIAELDDQ